MAIEKTASWVGASGTEYIFYVFERNPDVPKRDGLYIYAKRNAEGVWVPVYMGDGDLTTLCKAPATLRCIESKAATHVHLRLKNEEEDRAFEFQDLLAKYVNAFAPEGCQPRQDRAAVQASTSETNAASTTPAVSKTKKAASKKAASKKAASKKAAAKKTAPKKSATEAAPKRAAKKAQQTKAATKTPRAKKAAVKAKTSRPRS